MRRGKMRIVIFGSSGMLGQSALRERLGDRGVGKVLSVVRAPSGNAHEKLLEIVHNNFLDFTPIENQLAGLDGCLYGRGVVAISFGIK
jgi:nucleoside-diphosphate-sugar epimerase